MLAIRQYNPDDFEMIKGWWLESSGIDITPETLPIDTTFIGLIADEPALCISIYLTNTKNIAFLENFIGNPALKGPKRRELSAMLVNLCYDYMRSIGVKNVVCFSLDNKLVDRYQELGMELVASGLSSFGKRLL